MDGVDYTHECPGGCGSVSSHVGPEGDPEICLDCQGKEFPTGEEYLEPTWFYGTTNEEGEVYGG